MFLRRTTIKDTQSYLHANALRPFRVQCLLGEISLTKMLLPFSFLQFIRIFALLLQFSRRQVIVLGWFFFALWTHSMIILSEKFFYFRFTILPTFSVFFFNAIDPEVVPPGEILWVYWFVMDIFGIQLLFIYFPNSIIKVFSFRLALLNFFL